MSNAVPLTIDELERMRLLLRKVDVDHVPLTPLEETELRGYIGKSRPAAAQDSDLAALVLIGLFLLGLYVTILLAESSNSR